MFEEFSTKLRQHSVWSYLRHCPACGSIFSPHLWLCGRCFKTLSQYFLHPKDMVRWHPPFLHVRLIDWDEENNRWIQSIVQSLKGNYNSPLFQVIAKEFLFRFQQIPSMFKDFPFCFVPCPSKNLEKDHSFYLAQSFSKLTSLPMVECLKHPKKATTQKQKLKHSRIQKKLIRLDNKIPSHHSIVFVDDILTTGATAIAAKSALKSKCIFSTWSIFWRKNKFLF